MALQIQLRRGTASEWSSANPVLAEGELGVEKDTGKFKLGNGSSQWNSLLYSSGPSAIINTDGDPGQTLYVGTVDPSVDYSPVTGDVWLEVSL
jgi:hypothetical protein